MINKQINYFDKKQIKTEVNLKEIKNREIEKRINYI